MKLFGLFIALLTAAFGMRLLFRSAKTFIAFFTADTLPTKAGAAIFRDFALGILLIILAIAILS